MTIATTDTGSPLRLSTLNSLSEYVSSTTEFQVEYFTSKLSTKHWLICQAD